MATVTLDVASVSVLSGSWSNQGNASITSESAFMSSMCNYARIACRLIFASCSGLIPAGSTINSVTFTKKYKVTSSGGVGANLSFQPSYGEQLRGTATSISGSNISAVSSPLATVTNNSATYTLDELNVGAELYITYYVMATNRYYVNDAHIIIDYTEGGGSIPVEGSSTQGIVISTQGEGVASKKGSSHQDIVITSQGESIAIKTDSSLVGVVINTLSNGTKTVTGQRIQDISITAISKWFSIKKGSSRAIVIVNAEGKNTPIGATEIKKVILSCKELTVPLSIEERKVTAQVLSIRIDMTVEERNVKIPKMTELQVDIKVVD